MSVNIVDPGMLTTAINWDLSTFLPGTTWNGDLSGIRDYADAAPTFDTQHVVYTSAIQDAASQNSIGDNSNGLQDPLRLIPMFSYAYTTGYMNQRGSSQAVSVTLTQAFMYDFFAAKGSTTLSATGTFTWSNSRTDNNSTTITSSLQAPFEVPKGKIYEEKLVFSQEQAEVPYTTNIHIEGTYPVNLPRQGPVDFDIGTTFNFGSAEFRPLTRT